MLPYSAYNAAQAHVFILGWLQFAAAPLCGSPWIGALVLAAAGACAAGLTLRVAESLAVGWLSRQVE